MRQFPQLFDDFTRDDPQPFLDKLLSPNNIFVDIGPGVGIAAGFAVKPGLDMVLHLVMFDRRLRGREQLFLGIMEYYFRALRLRRMTAVIAADCEPALKLAHRLGFTTEGIVRYGVLRNGKYIDLHLLGLLREEFNGVYGSDTPLDQGRPNGTLVNDLAMLAGVGDARSGSPSDGEKYEGDPEDRDGGDGGG